MQFCTIIVFFSLVSTCLGALETEDNKDHKDNVDVGDVKGVHEGADVKSFIAEVRVFYKSQMNLFEEYKTGGAQNDPALMKKVINVLTKLVQETKGELSEAKYQMKRHNIPSDKKLREAVGRMVQSTLTFSRLALQFPKQFEKIYGKDIPFKSLVAYSFTFSDKLDVFDEDAKALIYLAKQQIGMVAKAEDFHNPYFKSKEELQEEAYEEMKRKEQKKKDEKKPVKKNKQEL